MECCVCEKVWKLNKFPSSFEHPLFLKSQAGSLKPADCFFCYLTCRSLVTADRWYKYNVRVSDLLQDQICVGFIEARASFPSLFYKAMIICRTRIGAKRHRPASCLSSSTGGSGVAGGWAHTMYELLTSLVETLIFFSFPVEVASKMLVKLLVPVFDSWTMQIVHAASVHATTSVSLTLRRNNGVKSSAQSSKFWSGEAGSCVNTPPQKTKVFIQAWIRRDSVLCCHFPLNINVLWIKHYNSNLAKAMFLRNALKQRWHFMLKAHSKVDSKSIAVLWRCWKRRRSCQQWAHPFTVLCCIVQKS